MVGARFPSYMADMPALPTHAPLLAVIAGLVLLIWLASRIRLLRGLLQLAVWGGLLWLLAVALGERGRFDPALGRLAGLIDGGGQTVSGDVVRVKLSRDGHFWVRATLDGVPRRLLVDSGATVTALSTDTARAAKLDVRRTAVPILLRTANGTVAADSARVATLRFGTITAHDLPVVVSPAFGGTDVLGMNFLSKLKSWRVEEGVLVLEPHHPQHDPAGQA
jgi:aspartyl protease family protein